MVINIWSFLLLVGLIQGGFLISVLLFHQGGNKPANRFLATLMAVITLQLFTYLLVTTNLYERIPHLINAGIPFLFLIGPLYYFYVKCLLENSCDMEVKDLWHIIPTILAAIYYIPFYKYSAETKIQIMRYLESQAVVEIPFETILFVGVHTLQTGIYIWLALRMLKTYHKRAQEQLFNGRRLKFKWLKQFSGVFLIYWLLSFLSLVALDTFDSYAPEIDYVVFLSFSILVSAVGYMGIKKSELFSDTISRSTSRKYQSSPLDQERAESIVQKLEDVMEHEQLYLQNDLRLSDVADELAINPNYLSQVINQEIGSNFNDFVNHYRVKEAQKRLRSFELNNKTILAIAYEVGFNNKNSFNKAFKKFTGHTPSRFIKNC